MSTIKTETLALPKTTALLSYFGSNRILASAVGKALDGCNFVVVPFAGGMCELLHINARTMLVGDKNRHACNLANVLKDPTLGSLLIRRLRREPFHPDTLKEAQEFCIGVESSVSAGGLFGSVRPDPNRLDWARAYFIASWMSRGGATGTDGEFNGGLSIRFDANGGDSNTRYRSSTNGLLAWQRVMRRCNFYCVDFRDLLARVKDDEGTGIFADAPWFGAGDGYKHKFRDADHRDLAALLTAYRRAKVIVRYDACAMTEELYPRTLWSYEEKTSRSQANKGVSEVIMTNRR